MGFSLYRGRLPVSKSVVAILSSDQGFGVVQGTVKKLGINSANIPVCIFKRSTRALLWETQSKADGSYSFRNIAVGLECFVVAFDPNRQYNAIISDMITTVDGRL